MANEKPIPVDLEKEPDTKNIVRIGKKAVKMPEAKETEVEA
jgi:hypothetical protein